MSLERIIEKPKTASILPSSTETDLTCNLERVCGIPAEVLSKRIIKTNGCCEIEEIYVRGHHPAGVDVIGYTGQESRIIRTRIKSHHVFKVK